MIDILHSIWHGMVSASWTEQLATVLGLLGVWFAVQQKLWNFPVGLVQVVLAGWVFFDQRLYADMSLQGMYFVVLAYGWWHWMHPSQAHRTQLPVTRLTAAALTGHVGLGLAATACWGVLLAHVGDAMPYRDAFLAAFGVISQWLQSRKKLEAWPGWAVVNITGLAIYCVIGLYWFVVLYLLYLLLSIAGYRAWRTSYAAEPIHA